MAKRPTRDRLKVKLRSGLSIGAAAAEDDTEFLRHCFVDSGYLKSLRDTENSRSIIVARTGAGKSALLSELAKCSENFVTIEPDQLAFTYIANSNILRFFENLGVNLDLFFQLLWKHVFCIELIKMRYSVKDEEEKKSVFSILYDMVTRDRKKEKALEYLNEWGDKFWLATDVRIKEITQNIESKLKASVDGMKLGLPLSAEYLGEMGTEIKKELLQRSQSVINEIQIKELHEVINLLAEDVFVDDEKHYFVLIDDLDRNWAFDPVRYKLIRALIETVKRLRRIRNVKIVSAIRTDLLDKVIEETIDAGFQHEKYEDSYLRVQWTERDLKTMLDRRVAYLYRSAYTKDDAQFTDLFPFKVHGQITSDYILERTQLRPRDAILFVNECLMGAAGATELTQTTIHEAEVRYSRGRLRSAFQEWANLFPRLELYSEFLHNKRARFVIGDIPVSELSEFCLKMATAATEVRDSVTARAVAIIESGNALGHRDFLDLLSELIGILQHVGLVGVKVAPQDSIIWNYRLGANVSRYQLIVQSRIYIHPMYWTAFGTKPLGPNEFRQ